MEEREIKEAEQRRRKEEGGRRKKKVQPEEEGGRRKEEGPRSTKLKWNQEEAAQSPPESPPESPPRRLKLAGEKDRLRERAQDEVEAVKSRMKVEEKRYRSRAE